MPAITADHVCKSFGRDRAVDDLSFTVPPGQVTGFLGPNGAGKTTTLLIILGLVALDSGTATIGDHAYIDLPSPISTVGAVREAVSFHPGRSGRLHLRELCRAAGLSTDRVDQVLAEVGLTPAADRRVGGYSLGMR
jgi:ABC-2 type transport system ATP-binding protein